MRERREEKEREEREREDCDRKWEETTTWPDTTSDTTKVGKNVCAPLPLLECMWMYAGLIPPSHHTSTSHVLYGCDVGAGDTDRMGVCGGVVVLNPS